MKFCPHCKNTYTDDTLQFCLQDGNPLEIQNATVDWTESETVVSSRNRQSYTTQNLPSQEWQQPLTTSSIPAPKSNKPKIFLLVSLALLLFFSIVGVGTWILITNMRKEIAQANVNKSLTNVSNRNTPKPPVNNSNANLTTANATLTPTPTPKPTLKPEDTEKAKNKIADEIDGWKNASENLDINEHLSYYSDTIDYYNGGKVNIAKVRADKEKAYKMYDSISINISNVNTTIDESGEKATSVFDKEWDFSNETKTNAGKVRQQLQFTKLGGEWRITSEKDLKVYYVNK